MPFYLGCEEGRKLKERYERMRDRPDRINGRKALLLAVAMCRHEYKDEPFDCARRWEAAERMEPQPRSDEVECLHAMRGIFKARKGVQAGFYQVSMRCLALHREPALLFRLACESWDCTYDEVRLALLECVFGPEDPVRFDKRWASRDAVAIAKAVEAERLRDGSLDPVRLSILADCLEDNGCDPRITEDLRTQGPVPRYMGYWPVDLVLGR